ncbi:hypothetical protein CROQUDRAFT_185427 [Cronartium quercuum f. sp. fusiforme G11]|uniref:RRM domain-containing protein n=1 Tax=Cronartium quercuum f. sp. fusiforme G11 TaxID=708437 RepID=A0A9P6NFR9_9BASI|nr:hypothetical protein CROQUDRAFT_185427 [Cronartium quercuum f. sp. fusiforme G11]
MAPKKKGTKVLLGDFLADDSMGRSWADEMDELPTAPAPRDPNDPPAAGLGGSHLSRFDGNNRYGDRDQSRRGGDRDMDRPPRAELPVPDKAPFNAFIGNLSWEVTNSDLEQFFGATHIISIRMMNDNATGKPKGYGYIEFDEREALVAALDKSGREVGGRVIRVSVAEAPKEREDRTGGAWRREGPLPSLDDNRRSRNPSNNYERTSMDEDRGERMGFGSKFVPSSTSSTGLGQRSHSGRGYSRAGFGEGGDYEGDNIDRGARMGFGSKFVPSVEEPRNNREPPKRGSNFVPSLGTPAGSDDGHSVSGGSTRRLGFADRKSSEGGLTPADSVSTWRSTRSPIISSDRESAPSSSTLPPTRRKLELSARTVSPSDGTSTPPQSLSASSKPSPFGAAKPVDSTEREKAIQEKLERERDELTALVAKKAAGLSHKPSQETVTRPQNEETASVASADPAPPPSSASKAPKPNPFGAAKPVDTLSKELEIEEKLLKEKKQLEKKIRKEAEEAKAAPVSKPAPPPPAEPNKQATVAPVVVTASSPSNPPSSKLVSSKWRSAGVETSKMTNGKATPTSTPVALNEPSPKSPSLSSFRKEGISFAALAKTAAATSPTQPKSSAGPEESRSKLSSQAPRTILKRTEGVSISNQ